MRVFCPRPFKHFEVSYAKGIGTVYMCCNAWLDTPIGDLRTQTVEEIWNGKTAQDIRRSILDGSFAYCSRSKCPYLDTVTGPVTRVEDVKDPDLRLAIDRQLTVLPYGPREVSCAYDRSCNLSCPSCRTSVIVDVANKDEILQLQHTIRRDGLRDTYWLNITGSGDPFGSPYFRKWLQTMRAEEMPSLRGIHLHTNAQLWTPAMWQSIPEEIRPFIKSAHISIDAASAATYADNRRGGSFDRLLENLEFIATLRRGGPINWLCISMVVQANNFREMPDFVRLGRRYGVDRIQFSELANWGTYSREEYARRAVHLARHPQHAEFMRLRRDKALTDPAVLFLVPPAHLHPPSPAVRLILPRFMRRALEHDSW